MSGKHAEKGFFHPGYKPRAGAVTKLDFIEVLSVSIANNREPTMPILQK